MRFRSPSILFRLVRDFQAALDTFNTIDEAVIPGVKRGIGPGQVTQMPDDGGLALLKIDEASAMFPLRLSDLGQLLPDHAEMFKDQVFDFLVHVGIISIACSIWRGQDTQSVAPVDAVRLAVVVVDGKDGSERFASGKMHQCCIGKIRPQIAAINRGDLQRAGPDTFPGDLNLARVVGGQVEKLGESDPARHPADSAARACSARCRSPSLSWPDWPRLAETISSSRSAMERFCSRAASSSAAFVTGDSRHV